MVRLPRNEKPNISIDLKTSNMTIGFYLGHDLDLEFSRSNMELAISLPKMSNCHETKSKHIDWTLCFKCDLKIWPWPWPWHWISNITFAISQPKVVRLPRNEKQTYRFELWASNVTNGLTLAMTLIFECSRPYMILTIWWPRSGVRIYKIMIGVTSDVGVTSTHLVFWGPSH